MVNLCESVIKADRCWLMIDMVTRHLLWDVGEVRHNLHLSSANTSATVLCYWHAVQQQLGYRVLPATVCESGMKCS